MDPRPQRTTPRPLIKRLARDAGIALHPGVRDIREVLVERGPMTGPITDAGTRALQQQRDTSVG